MATEDLNAGFIYLTNGTISGDTITYTGTQKVVKIFPTKIDDSFDNTLIAIAIPRDQKEQPAGGGSEVPLTLLVNLLRIKRAVIIQGFLIDESGSSAFTKKSDLITLNKYGGTLTLVWGLNSLGEQVVMKQADSEGVTIQKVMITETTGSIGEQQTGSVERTFAVQMTLIQGTSIDQKAL